MTPVYKEFLQYIKDTTGDKKLDMFTEGCYWLDRNIIKAFDSEGELHKIVRLNITDQLEASLKWYKVKEFKPVSWQESIIIHNDRLNTLEQDSINLINMMIVKFPDYQPIVLTSTGKDSEVVRYLVNKCTTPRVLFNNTSLDCAESYKYAKSIPNIEIINLEEGFYQWRERNNFVPTRMNRACCDIFKEGAMIKYLDDKEKCLFFLGMRKEESNTRSDYEDLWRNPKWEEREWQGVLPIVDWNEVDLWLYILREGIRIHDKYKKGYGRCGCHVACPFYTKNTWAMDKYWYPKTYKRWHNILDEDFVRNNKDMIMNCTQEEYHHCWNAGVYRSEPTQGIIETFAVRNNLNMEIAQKYFNHRCVELVETNDIDKFFLNVDGIYADGDGRELFEEKYVECGKKIRSKEIAGMNMKYYGRHIDKFKCKTHLMKDLGIKKDEWAEQVKRFKNQGCDLF